MNVENKPDIVCVCKKERIRKKKTNLLKHINHLKLEMMLH